MYPQGSLKVEEWGREKSGGDRCWNKGQRYVTLFALKMEGEKPIVKERGQPLDAEKVRQTHAPPTGFRR